MDKPTSWIEAAETDKADWYIHPSGGTEDYELSGKKIADEIMRLVKPSDKLAEYGCGNGRIMRHIKNDCTGFDIVHKFVQQANESGLKGYHIDDMHKHTGFDAIYSITVFIHLNKQDGKEALRKVHHSLKQGGLGLLQIPVYDVAKEPKDFIDVGVWDKQQLEDACKEIGFEIVELYTNPGEFSFTAIGENHLKMQVLRKL